MVNVIKPETEWMIQHIMKNGRCSYVWWPNSMTACRHKERYVSDADYPECNENDCPIRVNEVATEGGVYVVSSARDGVLHFCAKHFKDWLRRKTRLSHLDNYNCPRCKEVNELNDRTHGSPGVTEERLSVSKEEWFKQLSEIDKDEIYDYAMKRSKESKEADDGMDKEVVE